MKNEYLVYRSSMVVVTLQFSAPELCSMMECFVGEADNLEVHLLSSNVNVCYHWLEGDRS
jgi:hypothetical protein